MQPQQKGAEHDEVASTKEDLGDEVPHPLYILGLQVPLGKRVSMNSRTLSVVILTSKRASLLRRALASVRPEADGSLCFGEIQESAECAVPRLVTIQVIVVVNGDSDPETDQLLRSEANENEFLQVIRVTKQKPGSARNLGIEASGGEWVLFLDDDACIPAGGIQAISEVIGRAGNAGVVGGPNLTSLDATSFRHAVGKTLQSRRRLFLESALPFADRSFAFLRGRILAAL